MLAMELRSLAPWLWFLHHIAVAQNAPEPFNTSQSANSSLPADGSSSMNATSPAFPPCSRECITIAVAKSPCQNVENTTCVCNDPGFYKEIETCILAGCTPPEGIATQRAKADYCNDPVRSQVTMLYGLRSLEIAAWLLVLFRFYARWVTQRSFGWDDYTMMVVAVIYIPQLIISQLMDDNAFGRDIWDLEWSKIIFGLKLFFVQEPLYLLQLGLTKISILFLYLRIFPGRRFKIITYTFMAFVAGSTMTLVGGSVVECLPFGYFWNAWNNEYLIHTTKCVNLTVAVFAAAGLSILQDIIMIILPIPPLLKTQLPKKNKIAIATMFILGLLITGASCFRLQYVNVAYSPDPFWDFEPALLWSLVELAMSFLVTSLPALRNYYTKIIQPKLRAYMQSRRETKASETSGSGNSRNIQSHNRSRRRDRLGRTIRRRDNRSFISTMNFTRVSWTSLANREVVRTRDEGSDGIPAKAPQISLSEIGMSPRVGNDIDEERIISVSTEQEASMGAKRETAVHDLAWNDSHETNGLEQNNEDGQNSYPLEGRHFEAEWPTRGSIV